jgi:ATP-dependent DNA helicase RecG
LHIPIQENKIRKDTTNIKPENKNSQSKSKEDIPSKKSNLALQYIKGIGPKRAEALATVGILTIADLIRYLPVSYIDRASITSISKLKESLSNNKQASVEFEAIEDISENLEDVSFKNQVTIIAKITGKEKKIFGAKRKMLQLIIGDNSGSSAKIIFWQMIEFFDKKYGIGQTVAVSGKAEIDKFGISFSHPEIDILEKEAIENYGKGLILPKYRIPESFSRAAISNQLLSSIIQTQLSLIENQIKESLPEYILAQTKLPSLKNTLFSLHFPKSKEELDKAIGRAKFEEVFYYQIKIALSRTQIQNKEKAVEIPSKSALARQMYEELPFELTKDQKKVIREISSDLASGKPMNRLLQGDVGAGKTIVALLSILTVVEKGYQCAFLVPTEILAEQHYNSFKKYLDKYDLEIILLTGSLNKRYKQEIKENIASGKIKIIIGTHALFQDSIVFNKLAFVIIDEQHRFGVEQRAKLKSMASQSFQDQEIAPHILVMSATPIPRTLTLSVYGDLDVSIIKSMPANRKVIKTEIVYDKQLEDCYNFIKNEIRSGRQAYIVYPLVEESENLNLKSAITHYEILQHEIFADFKCGLLHGQMQWREKEEVMKDFLEKKYDILIATTVIEVGIDVPNATVMLIEDADRFGLAQLHQLRGRVGRGAYQSYCLLVAKEFYQYQIRDKSKDLFSKKPAVIRFSTMVDTSDGFEIAEVDMKLRGPGDILGTKQSGLPEFVFADLTKDGDLISYSRNIAFKLIEDDFHLQKAENKIIKETLSKMKESGKIFIDIA